MHDKGPALETVTGPSHLSMMARGYLPAIFLTLPTCLSDWLADSLPLSMFAQRELHQRNFKADLTWMWFANSRVYRCLPSRLEPIALLEQPLSSLYSTPETGMDGHGRSGVRTIVGHLNAVTVETVSETVC